MIQKFLLNLCTVLTLSLVAGVMVLPVFSGSAVAQAQGLSEETYQMDLGSLRPKGMETDVRESWRDKGIGYILERIVTIIAATIGSAAVLMMSVGGFMMITAGSSDERYTKGKSMISKSAMGLLFAFGAYIIVTTVQLLINSIYG
jgi:hypothetical protein